MSKNQLTKEELKIRVLKLKHQLYVEPVNENIKVHAHKYLNAVLDILDEYRY